MSPFQSAMSRVSAQSPPPVFTTLGTNAATADGAMGGQFQFFLDNALAPAASSPPPPRELTPPDRGGGFEREVERSSASQPRRERTLSDPDRTREREAGMVAWLPVVPTALPQGQVATSPLHGTGGEGELSLASDGAGQVAELMTAGVTDTSADAGLADILSRPVASQTTSVAWFASQWQGEGGGNGAVVDPRGLLSGEGQITGLPGEGMNDARSVSFSTQAAADAVTNVLAAQGNALTGAASQVSLLERNRQNFLEMAEQGREGDEVGTGEGDGRRSEAPVAAGGGTLEEMIKAANQLQTVRGVAPPGGQTAPPPHLSPATQAPLFAEAFEAAAAPEGGDADGQGIGLSTTGGTGRSGWSPAATPRTPVMRPDAADFADELAGRVGRLRIFSRPGQSEQVRITLDPQDLGEMTLRLRVDEENRVHLTIQTESEMAREALNRQMNQLKEALAQQDLGFGEVFVQVGDEGKGAWGGEGFAQGGGEGRSPSSSPAMVKAPEPTTAASTPRVLSGRVSIMA